MPPIPSDSRVRMLDAALAAFRRKGYTATTVDDICAATGLSKGRPTSISGLRCCRASCPT